LAKVRHGKRRREWKPRCSFGSTQKRVYVAATGGQARAEARGEGGQARARPRRTRKRETDGVKARGEDTHIWERRDGRTHRRKAR
jgi:hypothetical protein